MFGFSAELAELCVNFFIIVNLADDSHVNDWYSALATIKEIQGNTSNDLSFVACLLAEALSRNALWHHPFRRGGETTVASVSTSTSPLQPANG